MKIAISSQGPELDSRVDPRFGRAEYFIIYDTDRRDFVVLQNTGNATAGQGAGVQTAQLVARESVSLVVSGNMGPKAFEALRSAGIQVVAWNDGTIAEAVELIRSGQFDPLDGANVRGHWR
jgi:predicted Fe-Mo cluster-binding NifX family protein